MDVWNETMIALQHMHGGGSLENAGWLRPTFESIAVGVVVKDAEGRLLHSNPAFRKMLGYAEEELQAMLRQDFTHPEDVEKDSKLYSELLRGERESFQIEKRYVKKDGGLMWGRLSVSRVEGTEVGTSLTVGVVEDISELKKSEAALSVSETRFRAVVEQSPLSIHVFDPEGRSIRANDSWNRLWYLDEGEEPEDANVFEDEQLRVAGLLPYVRDGAAGIAAKIPPMLFDPARAGRDGEPRWLEGVIYPLRDASGGITEATLMLEDVTERKALEDTLAHQALHDSLTNLPNRTLFLDRLGQALARLQRGAGQSADEDAAPGYAQSFDRGSRGEEGVAVLFIDLDNLKVVNDSLGHDAGDRLLVEASRRFESRLRPTDTLARLAGDEFVILLENVDEAEAVRAAERISQGIVAPFTVSEQEFSVSISVGIALGRRSDLVNGRLAVRPDDQSRGHSPEVLLRHADLAMYEAKKRGKGRHVFYEERMGLEAGTRLQLENDLRHALQRREIEVYYQPKISLKSNRVVGVEVLARWRHPRRGLMLPAEFIGLAERTGLIVDLGYQVLGTALQQAGEWHEHWRNRRQAADGEPFPPVVWVNLSARQFHETDLAGRISNILAETGVEPGALGLEITESILVEDVGPSVSLLKDLKHLGVKLAVDDFGTGYSSLSYLTRLPVDYLKIDRSFINELVPTVGDTESNTESNFEGKAGNDTGSATVISAVIGLARAMGMKVVAEGVETQGQLSRLKEMGCDFAQGYHLARPMPVEETSKYLAAKEDAGDHEPGQW